MKRRNQNSPLRFQAGYRRKPLNLTLVLGRPFRPMLSDRWLSCPVCLSAWKLPPPLVQRWLLVTVQQTGSGAVMDTNHRSYSRRNLSAVEAVHDSTTRIAGEELQRVAVDCVLMTTIDLRRNESWSDGSTVVTRCPGSCQLRLLMFIWCSSDSDGHFFPYKRWKSTFKVTRAGRRRWWDRWRV